VTESRSVYPSGSRWKNFARFSQIGRVLVRHGFGFVFDVRRERREKRGAEEVLAPNCTGRG
jgi:ubiquinone biosynthesis protein